MPLLTHRSIIAAAQEHLQILLRRIGGAYGPSKNGEHLKIRILSPQTFFLHGLCVPQRRHKPKHMLIEFPKNQLCFLDYESERHPSHKILQEHARMPRSMMGRFLRGCAHSLNAHTQEKQ